MKPTFLHPALSVILPYCMATVIFPIILAFYYNINPGMLTLVAVIIFHPFWNFLTRIWLDSMRAAGVSEDHIKRWVKNWFLDCGDLMVKE